MDLEASPQRVETDITRMKAPFEGHHSANVTFRPKAILSRAVGGVSGGVPRPEDKGVRKLVATLRTLTEK